MKNDTVRVNIGGLFTTLLGIAFIVLKLCNVINWSWWWVLSPLWIPLALVIIIALVVTIITGIVD